MGAQGGKRSGLVQAPEGLPPNPDLLEAASFRLPHRRPGTVSLNLSGAPLAHDCSPVDGGRVSQASQTVRRV